MEKSGKALNPPPHGTLTILQAIFFVNGHIYVFETSTMAFTKNSKNFLGIMYVVLSIEVMAMYCNLHSLVVLIHFKKFKANVLINQLLI